MVVLLYASSVQNIKGLLLATGFLDGLSLEIELKIEGIVELSSFFVLHVQFRKD